jgi:hypothetical protein
MDDTAIINSATIPTTPAPPRRKGAGFLEKVHETGTYKIFPGNTFI